MSQELQGLQGGLDGVSFRFGQIEGGEFVFVEESGLAGWGDPEVEGQVFAVYGRFPNHRRPANITIPTLQRPIIPVVDGKNVVPAVAVKILYKPVAPLKRGEAQIGVIPVEKRLQPDKIRPPFQHLRRILPDGTAVFVEFVNNHSAEC